MIELIKLLMVPPIPLEKKELSRQAAAQSEMITAAEIPMPKLNLVTSDMALTEVVVDVLELVFMMSSGIVLNL